MELAGAKFGWWMSLGVVGLFCIERFIAPHSHEVDAGSGHNHDHEDEHKHECSHEHHPVSEKQIPHQGGKASEPRAAAPAVAGWMAVVGLTIHTFMNGVGLAGEVHTGFGIAPRLAGFANSILT